MNIKLVFSDWVDKTGKSIYSTEIGIKLSKGCFHSGTTFEAVIDVSQDEKLELLKAFSQGFHPVFKAVLG